MSKKFTIDDEFCRLNVDGVEKSAYTEAVAKYYFSGGAPKLGLLPPAVRWLSSDGFGFVFERPPFEHELSYKGEKFSIPVPWTVWGVRFSTTPIAIEKAWLYVRSFPMGVLEDPLLAFPYPGLTGDHEVATPYTQPGKKASSQLKAMTANFWRSFTGSFLENNHFREELLPVSWREEYAAADGDVAKFLTHLRGIRLQDALFSEFHEVSTLQELTERLDTKKENTFNNVFEFFEHLLDRAQQ